MTMQNRARRARWTSIWLTIPTLLTGAAVAAEPLEIDSSSPSPSSSSPSSPPPLRLEDVLEAVERSFPLLLATQLEFELARGGLLEARGSFDSVLSAGGSLSPTGYYDRFTAQLGIEQPTRLWGSRLFAGYRIGRGDFPSYLGGDKTNEDGELRAGIDIPLLKDGFIDANRTRLRASQIRQDAALPAVELRRIEIVRDASEAYWNWVAMGRNVDVEQQLLATAQARRIQLEGRAEGGAIPKIQVVDNERLVLDREIRLRGAQRDALESALVLSLYLRDELSRTLVPEASQIPRDFPPEAPPHPDEVGSDIERASDAHPIVRNFQFRRQETLARLALERNTLLPDLRVGVEASQDVGESAAGIDSVGSLSSNPKDDTDVKAGVRLTVPMLQRGARGRVVRVRAELAKLDHEAGYARDQIGMEIRRAMASLEAAYDQTRLARENLALATRLQRGEERKFSLGSSNLIDVNIRELQTADAARALVFAQAAYFRATARYRAAVATPGSPRPDETAAPSAPDADSGASP